MISHIKTSMVVLVLCGLFSTGCSVFQSSKKADMAAFGENTSVMVTDLKEGLAIKRAVLIAPYLQGEAINQFRKQRADLTIVLAGVVFYSTQLVNISRSKFTEPEKSKLLGEYITKLAGPVVNAKDPDIRVTKEKLDAMVQTIESQAIFLDALGAAQPLVDAMENYVRKALDNMDDIAEQIAAEATVRIEQHFSGVLSNKAALEALQTLTVKSFYILSTLRAGEDGALDALLLNDPAFKKYVKTGSELKPKDMDLIEKELMQRFENNQAMLEKLYSRLDEYRAHIQELDEVKYSFEGNAKKMHLSMMLWARSHANLAAGIDVPPAIDIGGMILDAAKKAIP